MTLNVAAFYQKYKRFLYSTGPVPYVNDTTPTALAVSTAGALAVNADAKVRGSDFEVSFRPSVRFSPISAMRTDDVAALNSPTLNDGNWDGIADNIAVTTASQIGDQTVANPVSIRYCASNAAMANQFDPQGSLSRDPPISSHHAGYRTSGQLYAAEQFHLWWGDQRQG